VFDRERIRGIIPPLATPLTKEEELDESGLRRLICKLLDAGCEGVFVLGGTGEGIYLTDKVQARMIEVTVDEVAGRVPVIAGVSDMSVKRAVVRGRQAARLGADVLISTAPYQLEMEPQEVYDYFVALAEETDMPTMLYNVPPWVRTNITVDTIVRLAEHNGIVGMKDSADFTHLTEVLLHTRGTGFRLLCGMELNFVPAMMMGAIGGTLAVANLWPDLCIEAYEAGLSGNDEKARNLHLKLSQFMQPVFKVPWGAACKYGLSLMGICGPTQMRPQLGLTEAQARVVEEWLKQYDLI